MHLRLGYWNGLLSVETVITYSKDWVTTRESPKLMQLTSLAPKKEQLPYS